MSVTRPKWQLALPMWLTWSRIIICPVLVVLLIYDNETLKWISAAIFILASMTDWFDGSLARKFGVESNLGRFMDPIADKILVASVLIMLIPDGRAHPIMVLLLLARDILIGGIRAVAAADKVIISAKAAGKWKTGLQMVAIPALLMRFELPMLPFTSVQFGQVLLWLSVGLSVVSGIQYYALFRSGSRSS